ncbi:sporulation protein YpjB [Desulfuribacillus alkaliarsenatis]|uniref:Sporulation protein YpjB n=1 Tax=Desulfuribacillus alkaliarsenatis TaxID=766136 RepID=A0A1E5G6D8_9FIRM|nr:sporulation protein YpjB [Desulfuribacillus alkaliarsenatis]OEF98736.1 hypothetical protein BHF68_03495 [Desulfuribacillus alkaliarsenatis]
MYIYMGMKKLLVITLCIFLININFVTITLASDNSSRITNNGQNINDYSSQVIYFINHEKYAQAKEVLLQMINYYLSMVSQVDISLEAHNAYTQQLLVVKSELSRGNINRLLLIEESYKLHIASEVLSKQSYTEFAKQMDLFHKSAVNLLNELDKNSDSEINNMVNELEENFLIVSIAMQIMYPQEYHNQISSIINYLKKVDSRQIQSAKEAIEYLATTLEKLNDHAQQAHGQLVYTTMTPQSYLMGISAVTAIAIMTIFWRRWKLAS